MTKLTDRERELQAEVNRLRAREVCECSATRGEHTATAANGEPAGCRPAPERLRPAREVAHEILDYPCRGLKVGYHSVQCDRVTAIIEADRAARQPGAIGHAFCAERADVERLRALTRDVVSLDENATLETESDAECMDEALSRLARQAREALKP